MIFVVCGLSSNNARECHLLRFSVVLFAVKFTNHLACVPAHVVGRGTKLTIVEDFVLCPPAPAIVADYAVSCTTPLLTVPAVDAVGGMLAVTVLSLRNGGRRRNSVLTNIDVDIVSVAVIRVMMDVIAPALGALSFVRIVIVAMSVISLAQSATCGTVLTLASCSHHVLPVIIEHVFHPQS